MSEVPRSPDKVLRRRVRQSQFIEIPEPTSPAKTEGARERAKVLVLVLIGTILTGGILLATPLTTQSGERTPLIDSIFTSTSAVAVTGLVTKDTGTHWNPLGQVVILVLIQIGGLGFMVGAGLLFQMARGGGTSLRQTLFMHDGSASITLRQAASLARQIAIFTFAVEAVGWALLTVAFSRNMGIGQAAWHGLFHTVSAFCNAGFDLQGNFQSLTAYDNSVLMNVTVIAMVQAGSLSFLVANDFWRFISTRWGSGPRARLQIDSKIILTGNFVLLGVGLLSMLLFEWNGLLGGRGIGQKIMAGTFQSAAARTAGFSTVAWDQAHSVTEFVWLVLMMIGGASGSTAGGVKIATVAVILIAVLSSFRGETEADVFRRRIPPPVVMRAMAVVAFFLTLHFAGTLLLASSEVFIGGADRDFIKLLFETMSALATVGLSTGITPDLTESGKAVLCVLMFVGRLGPLTLAYALQMKSHQHRYRYPVGEVRIG